MLVFHSVLSVRVNGQGAMAAYLVHELRDRL